MARVDGQRLERRRSRCSCRPRVCAVWRAGPKQPGCASVLLTRHARGSRMVLRREAVNGRILRGWGSLRRRRSGVRARRDHDGPSWRGLVHRLLSQRGNGLELRSLRDDCRSSTHFAGLRRGRGRLDGRGSKLPVRRSRTRGLSPRHLHFSGRPRVRESRGRSKCVVCQSVCDPLREVPLYGRHWRRVPLKVELPVGFDQERELVQSGKFGRELVAYHRWRLGVQRGEGVAVCNPCR